MKFSSWLIASSWTTTSFRQFYRVMDAMNFVEMLLVFPEHSEKCGNKSVLVCESPLYQDSHCHDFFT